MQIVLIRHGKPKIEHLKAISANEFGLWVQEYDLADIDMEYLPSNETLDIAQKCSKIICSDLPRSIISARLLQREPDIIDIRFREAKMPSAKWTYPIFSTKTWMLFFRVFQLLGYSANAETIFEIKSRAEGCTETLVKYAKEHGSVLFVGHGIINWFIERRLKSMSWYVDKRSNRDYWGYRVYRYSV